MAKKFQLSELKVTSFVTAMNENEQQTAKGGFLGGRRALINHRTFRQDWTMVKTQLKISLNNDTMNGKFSSKKR